MDRETFQQFKTLLLGIPGWNHGGARKAFLQDCFWGHALLSQLSYGVPGDRAATELIELLDGLESPDVDGLTPACALLKSIRVKYGAGPQREKLLAALERSLCDAGASIRSVLFCAANPEDQDLIRTDAEYREIKRILARSPQGKGMSLQLPELAARAKDLPSALHDTQPDLVHFSGHGGGDEGIYLEDDRGASMPVTADALASLFRQFRHCVKVVVLNACFSEAQAEAIAEHIDYVIGTRQDIGDDTAIAFSRGFYEALSASPPRSVEDAFQDGCVSIRLAGIPEHLIPLLITRDGDVTSCA